MAGVGHINYNANPFQVSQAILKQPNTYVAQVMAERQQAAQPFGQEGLVKSNPLVLQQQLNERLGQATQQQTMVNILKDAGTPASSSLTVNQLALAGTQVNQPLGQRLSQGPQERFEGTPPGKGKGFIEGLFGFIDSLFGEVNPLESRYLLDPPVNAANQSNAGLLDTLDLA